MLHQLIRALYNALNDRDLDAALALMHPRVTWSKGVRAGTVRGKRQVGEYLATLTDRFESEAIGVATTDVVQHLVQPFEAVTGFVNPEDVGRTALGVVLVDVDPHRRDALERIDQGPCNVLRPADAVAHHRTGAIHQNVNIQLRW